MCRKYLLVLICFTHLGGFAQERWSLDSCIQLSIRNNLTLRNASIQSEVANISFKQSKWNYLPSVYAGSNAGMNFGRSVDPTDNGVIKTSFLESSYYVNASLELFNGFSQLNKLAYQRYLAISAEHNQRKIEDEIAFSVMNAYFDVAYFDELVAITAEQRNLSKLNLRKTEVLVTTGLKSESDLLEVKANMEKDELYYIQTQNQLEAARITLMQLMNISVNTPLDVAIPSDSLIVVDNTVDGDSLFHDYSQISPTINYYENEYMASRKNIGVSRGAYYPSLKLQASYSTGYYETSKDTDGKTYAFGEQFRNNQSQYVGLSLSVPLFVRNSARFGVKQAKLQSEQSKNLLEKAKQDLQLEITDNVNKYIAAEKEYRQAKVQLAADRLAFDAAQKKYDKGMISVVDFYTAKSRLSTIQGQALRARLTLEVKRYTIDFYRGVRFWEN